MSSTIARWKDINQILQRPGPFSAPGFEPSSENLDQVRDSKILIVGAGGLGCELLKDFALSGFSNIHIIDLDTIDISNLNRQFLFRTKDVGRMKAEVAAEFVMRRVPGVTVTPYCRRLESFDKAFYRSFSLVVAGLDNVQARRWLNAMLVSLANILTNSKSLHLDLKVEFDEDGQPDGSTVIPFLDGGTEGFKGQARLFFPRFTACYECSVSTLPAQRTFAMCTLASVPRLPEHCIAYAREKLWNLLESFTSAAEFVMYQRQNENDEFEPCAVKFDADNPDHMTWVFQRSTERAAQFNIRGVTYSLTMQVTKNIIPAIASTNALISAVCTNEAFKFRSMSSLMLSNYFMYFGNDGTYSNTFCYERNPDCIVCGNHALLYELDGTNALANLLDKLKTDSTLKLKNPSVTVGGKAIYMSNKLLAAQYAPNLPLPLSQLFESGATLYVSDREVLGDRLISLRVHFVEGAFHVPVPAE